MECQENQYGVVSSPARMHIVEILEGFIPYYVGYSHSFAGLPCSLELQLASPTITLMCGGTSEVDTNRQAYASLAAVSRDTSLFGDST